MGPPLPAVNRGRRPMIRLTLISHGATAALRRAAFPGDEPLDARGTAAAAALAGAIGSAERVLVGPALRARQTAVALELPATIDEGLRDLDYGRWAGATLKEIAAREPAAVAAWLGDPAAARMAASRSPRCSPAPARGSRRGRGRAGRRVDCDHACRPRARRHRSGARRAGGGVLADRYRAADASLAPWRGCGLAAPIHRRCERARAPGPRRSAAPAGGTLAEAGAELGPEDRTKTETRRLMRRIKGKSEARTMKPTAPSRSRGWAGSRRGRQERGAHRSRCERPGCAAGRSSYCRNEALTPKPHSAAPGRRGAKRYEIGGERRSRQNFGAGRSDGRSGKAPESVAKTARRFLCKRGAALL